MNNRFKGYWIRLTGDPVAFSMENRAFNLVSVISLVMLFYAFIFDAIISQWQMCLMIALLFFLQILLYYRSLYLKKYRTEIIIYAIACYATLVVNYHFNSGLAGPTLFMCFAVCQLILTISPMRYNKFWLMLFITVPTALIITEYYFPAFAPDSYMSRGERFFDLLSTFVLSIVSFYFVATYLKRYYKSEKRLSEERHAAISAQNDFIRKQNEVLEQLNIEKNRIFSIISHDLRSPIDSIRGYLEILAGGGFSDAEKQEMETELLNHVKHTSDLLQNLLHWSKTQMNGVNVKLLPVRLMDILENVTNTKLTGALQKNIKITYSVDRDLEIIADIEMLKLVLRNLVVNAVKFTRPGGEVQIKAIPKGDLLEIAVKDNGVGIPEAKQKLLFSLNSGSTYGTGNEKGIGLGLILCKDFTERQGGRIWFESKEGVGSTFYISHRLARN